jgi:hypothetical protein
MFHEDVAPPLIRQLDQQAQGRTREQGHWSVLDAARGTYGPVTHSAYRVSRGVLR